ncbi:MAG TPA: hypothetical protein VER32_11820 [Pyrinomonadaceae bacterium]|nr:hypothetical protein [Pyrinomonadaceae bacterium]
MSGPEVSRGGALPGAAEVTNPAATPGGAPFARPHSLAPEAERRIRRLLVAKAALETLFVVALAAAFFHVNWNPRVRGAVASDGRTRVEGWVAGGRADSALEVQLFVDGRFVASATADGEPPKGGERPAGARGFSFALPRLEPGEHEARVYAVHVGGGRTRLALHPVGGGVRVRGEGVE